VTANADPTLLSWSGTALMELDIQKTGVYTFSHAIEYILTNQYGESFDYFYDGFVSDVINVREGLITINIDDELGNGIPGATIYIDNVAQVNTSTVDGIYIFENVAIGDGTTFKEITTGDYVIEVEYPSGYAVPSGSGYTINAENNIELSTTINYDNYDYVKDITLEKLTIQNLYVTTIGGDSSIDVNPPTTTVSAIVGFTTLSELNQLSLNIADTFPTEDITFTLSSVKNSSGYVMSDFSQSGTEIIYNNPSVELPIDAYKAYIEVTLPSSIMSGDSFDVTVDSVEIDGLMVTTSCNELTITYLVRPEDTTLYIELVNNSMTLQHYCVDVSIKSDETDIVAYMCLPGDLTIADFTTIADTSVGVGLNNIDATDLKAITAKFDIYYDGTSADNTHGVYIQPGIYTVYAKNAAGLEMVKTVEIQDQINADYDLL
jgi:hypothetical protein